jgi:GntP family gluconate:H+ symporter
MLLASIALGIAHGRDSQQMIAAFNSGFGSALGEYALILLPSFTLAAAISKVRVSGLAEWVPAVLAPVVGAAMVCPDTAYATLRPFAGRHKLTVLFGAYAGFKLLVPAGPIIVATGLGAMDKRLPFATLPVFAAAWMTGLLYARFGEVKGKVRPGQAGDRFPIRLLSPLATLVGLLAAGLWLCGGSPLPPLADFLVSPKGALLTAAIVALIPLTPQARTEAVESAMKRTAPLLLIIGTASALGAMITQTLPIAAVASLLAGDGLVLPALFAFTAVFKLAKGSSMATFAGTTGIIAPLLPALQVSPPAAVLAMCAGAFVTIAPNDSLYWIAREDFAESGVKLGRLLAIGAALQGFSALAAVELLNLLGVV